VPAWAYALRIPCASWPWVCSDNRYESSEERCGPVPPANQCSAPMPTTGTETRGLYSAELPLANGECGNRANIWKCRLVESAIGACLIKRYAVIEARVQAALEANTTRPTSNPGCQCATPTTWLTINATASPVVRVVTTRVKWKPAEAFVSVGKCQMRKLAGANYGKRRPLQRLCHQKDGLQSCQTLK